MFGEPTTTSNFQVHQDVAEELVRQRNYPIGITTTTGLLHTMHKVRTDDCSFCGLTNGLHWSHCKLYSALPSDAKTATEYGPIYPRFNPDFGKSQFESRYDVTYYNKEVDIFKEKKKGELTLCSKHLWS